MRVILFPGQGAQTVGMGKDFFERSEAARSVFERADEVLGMGLSRICFEGPEERLAETDVCQPAIFACSVAIVRALEERGVLKREDFGAAAGLSLGEYTALWFAGSLSLEDGLRLVRLRGRAMQDASDQSPSGMVSLLGAQPEQAHAVCDRHRGDDVLVTANYLAPGNIVVSGSQEAVARVARHAKEDGVRRAIPLKVAGAFHSPLMEPAVPILSGFMDGIEFQEPSLPVISNVTAAAHGDVASIRDVLRRQVTSPVLWERSMQALIEQGANEFLEPGPGTVLAGLIGKIDRDLPRHNVNRVEELDQFVTDGLAAGEADA